MPILRITRGLPGSGKTTRARAWVAASPMTRVRVNRDDLRVMLHGDRLGRQWQEDQVTVAQQAMVSALLTAGLDVIADDTSLHPATMRAWQRLADRCGARVEIDDLTGVPVEVCIARDAARGAAGGRKVGADIIRQMAATRGRVLTPPGPMP